MIDVVQMSLDCLTPVDCFYDSLPGMSLYEIQVEIRAEKAPWSVEFFAHYDVESMSIERCVFSHLYALLVLHYEGAFDDRKS